MLIGRQNAFARPSEVLSWARSPKLSLLIMAMTAYEEYQAVLENVRCLALILQAELLTTLGQPRKKPVK